ncbi:hypothetical protein NBRC110019_13010 [Neptunitalea chrysea]|uniref:Cytochrome c domain-containing protein n=1 Tax=Neptunitalea chrysea TaxID=1647581 RepID=A0A9W6B5J9_9FLAO|nr:cytochrome c [Neptunitalea chrysea]GLB52262.1 hypothetical protein NBRC110019_13010 [Neptunitalea chrysea]
MKIYKSLTQLIFITLFILATHSISAQDDAVAGKKTFNTRCAACHSVAKKMVGPALKNVDERHTEEWIINFVHSSQTVIKLGDVEAVRLFKENNQVVMPDHPDLTATDIKNVLTFIKEESTKVGAKKELKIVENYEPYKGESSAWHKIVYLDVPGDHKPVTKDDTFFWGVLTFSILIFVGALLLFVKIGDMGDVIIEITKKKKQ